MNTQNHEFDFVENFTEEIFYEGNAVNDKRRYLVHSLVEKKSSFARLQLAVQESILKW